MMALASVAPRASARRVSRASSRLSSHSATSAPLTASACQRGAGAATVVAQTQAGASARPAPGTYGTTETRPQSGQVCTTARPAP